MSQTFRKHFCSQKQKCSLEILYKLYCGMFRMFAASTIQSFCTRERNAQLCDPEYLKYGKRLALYWTVMSFHEISFVWWLIVTFSAQCRFMEVSQCLFLTILSSTEIHRLTDQSIIIGNSREWAHTTATETNYFLRFAIRLVWLSAFRDMINACLFFLGSQIGRWFLNQAQILIQEFQNRTLIFEKNKTFTITLHHAIASSLASLK